MRDRATGLVAAAPGGLAPALAELAADEDLARRLGTAGQALGASITWERVVEELSG